MGDVSRKLGERDWRREVLKLEVDVVVAPVKTELGQWGMLNIA